MKYRHKPTVTDIQIWTGNPADLTPGYAAAICQPPCTLGGDRYENGVRLPHIDTRHGPVELRAGWGIVPEPVGGGFYPIAPEVIAACYEPCEDGEA